MVATGGSSSRHCPLSHTAQRVHQVPGSWPRACAERQHERFTAPSPREPTTASLDLPAELRDAFRRWELCFKAVDLRVGGGCGAGAH